MPSPDLLLRDDERRLVIRASAGTGKTFQLSNRYITLLRTAPPDRILASTFTRKAAGEILERILIRLAKAALDQKALDELSPFAGKPPINRQMTLGLLQEFTRHLHRVQISTLDSFFARLAGSFSLELGLPPGWRIMDEMEAGQLRDQAIETFLRTGEPHERVQLMHLLDKGNTKRSVHQLVVDKIKDFYGVFLNSSAESWNRFPPYRFLTERQQIEIIDQIQAVPIGDRRTAKRRDQDCELMRLQKWDEISSKGLYPKAMDEGTYYGKQLPEVLVQLYRQLEPQIQAHLVAPLAHQTEATRQLLEDFHRAYETLKYEARGLRFDDITRKLAEAFTLAGNSQSTAELSFRLDGEIDHILLDEFQDTSQAQWKVIRPFAEAVCAESGPAEPDDESARSGTSFFCVGDTKQAIYGWRGGEAALFETIERHLPGLVTQPLNRSYRSSPVITETANRVFTGIAAHNNLGDLHQTVQQWADHFPRHETDKTALPGYVRFQTGPIPVDFDGDGRSSAPLTEALWPYTATYVRDRLHEAPGATIGVLTRTNDAVRRLIYELNRIGVDASEEGGSPLTDSAAVQLVLSLMTLADHPGHTIARFHVARSPLGTAFGYTDHTEDGRAHAFSHTLRARLAREGYGPVMHDLFQKLGPVCNRRESRRLAQLASLADTFDATAVTLRPSRFVEFVRTEKVEEPTAAPVRVMTIHQSKGLEFDVVILPELDKNLTTPPSYVTLVPEPDEPPRGDGSEHLHPAMASDPQSGTGAPNESREGTPELVALAASQSNFEVMSGELYEAYRQTQARNMNEALCNLYVAVTRAVHSLHLLIRPSTAKSQGNHAKTYAGLLRAALSPEARLDAETVLYEEGDPRWFDSLAKKVTRGDKPSLAHHHQEADAAPLTRIPWKPATGRRHLERVAPSRPIASHPVQLRQMLPMGNAVSLERGTLFHRWLEEIRWLDDGLPDAEELLRLGREMKPVHLDPEECLETFLQMLRAPAIARILSRESYQAGEHLPFSHQVREVAASKPFAMEAFNERRFAVLEEGRIVTGSIDRLVLLTRDGHPIAADVIDFKTDGFPDDPRVVNDRIEHYRGQLSAYVGAVEKTYCLPRENIAARLVLLTLGQVETVAVAGP